MKNTKPAIFIFGLVFTDLYISVTGYPMINTANNLVNKDEKRYPNGTVIGRYTYKDNEGNPIQVKYYANDASYGVELNSVKVVNSDSAPLETDTKYQLEITEHPFESAFDPLTGYKDLTVLNKNLTHETLQTYKDKLKGDLKHTDEFEVLLQNELKAPEKCGKEKVKVYFDKDKRKSRHAPNNLDSLNYCNRI